VSRPVSRGPRSLPAATCTARQIAGATVFAKGGIRVCGRTDVCPSISQTVPDCGTYSCLTQQA